MGPGEGYSAEGWCTLKVTWYQESYTGWLFNITFYQTCFIHTCCIATEITRKLLEANNAPQMTIVYKRQNL